MINVQNSDQTESMPDNNKIRELINSAVEARERSYSPYSNFMVGAALLCADGSIFQGCNIENASYPATNCAERTAFYSAVAAGKREFAAIAIVGGYKGGELEMCYPCGICRQVMSEFCSHDKFNIIIASSEDVYELYTLGELLPKSFSLG